MPKTQPRRDAMPGLAVIAAIVFGAGAIVMAIELVASRLLAPHFGNSLFVWTSIIGVMLGFMSLGYFLGGRYADRHLHAGNLFWILVGSASFVALTAFSESWLLPALARGGSLRVSAVLATTVLFAVPSTLLGMVSPYCVRLRMHAVEDSGATVGELYAISTLGSIVGTFATGFWLISIFGTRHLIALLAAGLALLSLLVAKWGLDVRKVFGLVAVVLLVGLAFTGVARGEETIDTRYDRYILREGVDPVTGAALIGLSRDQISAESAAYKDTGKPYRFDYYNYYDLASVLNPPVKRALLIGGGTLSYPRLFVAANRESKIDVVEIDPALYDIAKRSFGYFDDPRIKIHLEDGRTLLNRATGTYDAVFMDAFKSEETVPYQLATQEVWKRCYDLLDGGGVVVMNVIASPSDERAEFFNALYATIASVFPNVQAFQVQDDTGKGLQNTSIVAVKDPKVDIMSVLTESAPEFASHAIAGYNPPAGTRLLTDDFAPVDQYLLGF